MDLLEMWGTDESDGQVADGRARGDVDDLRRRFLRADLHVLPGPEAVQGLRAAGGEAPQGQQAEGRHRRLAVEELQVQATWPRWCWPACRSTKFQQDTGVQLDKDDVVDSVRRAIQRASALTAADLKKGLGFLATIGSTAVFVGLLATTIGVINAFQGIAQTGSGGLGAVSGGISEALVGTAIGLFVAIPAVWFYNYLTGPDRVLQRRDGQLVVRARGLLHQEVVNPTHLAAGGFTHGDGCRRGKWWTQLADQRDAAGRRDVGVADHRHADCAPAASRASR